MWEELINKIKTILEANTLIKEVYIYECEKFNGSPACSVTPSENASDYNTNEENIRLYSFHIRLFVNRSVAPAGSKPDFNADKVMRKLVDSVLDDFDKNYTLSGITNPTGYTFINLFAVPSGWGYAGREDEYRAAEINLKCRVSVDLNAIS